MNLEHEWTKSMIYNIHFEADITDDGLTLYFCFKLNKYNETIKELYRY